MMEERKCPECGVLLPPEASSCPNCGCPVDVPTVEEISTQPAVVIPEEPQEKPRKKKAFAINVAALLSLLLGVVIFVMGGVLASKKPDVESFLAPAAYRAANYDADSARFGADFYTEIYAASDTIVDALDDINKGIVNGSNDMNDAMQTLSTEIRSSLATGYSCAGVIVMAIGLSTVAHALPSLKKRENQL